MKNFLSPIIGIIWALGPVLAYGFFETKNEKSFDVWLNDNLWALLWPAGVISGYILWDLTQPYNKSHLKSWWRKFLKKDPLVFFVTHEVTESKIGIRSEIQARFNNNSDRKIKNACLTVEKWACDGGDIEYIEYCLDVPANAEGLKVPLFEVNLHEGANIAQYRISDRYLKSKQDTDWCTMTEMAFEFEPCFSTDTQREQCAIHCTVVAPFSAKQPIKIFSAYGD